MGAGHGKQEVPKTMKRLEISEYNTDIAKIKISVVEAELPVPKKGQVLVKVLAAPVNPSDYMAFRAAPEDGSPHLLGKEGSGIVVASGGGYTANSLVGKNVGFVLTAGGSYSEYAVADTVSGCWALPAGTPVEDAASFFVNPYTACGFVDTVKNMGATGFVHTAAASQLGQMLVKLCKLQGLTLINVVRRTEQADMLKKLGAEHVVVTSEPEWKTTLAEKMKELNVSIIFDAIAGDNTGDMMSVLPNGGTTFVYGALSGKGCCNIHPLDLIYRKKKVQGWLLPSWIRDDGMLKAISRTRWASGLVLPNLTGEGWAASTFEDTTLENMWPKFLEMWNGGSFTNKKLRIIMPVPEPVKAPEAPATEAAKEEDKPAEEKKEEAAPKTEETKPAEAPEKTEEKPAEKAEEKPAEKTEEEKTAEEKAEPAQ